MNLMCKLKKDKNNAKIKRLIEKKEKYKIKTTPVKNATLVTSGITYFLNCVPEIPSNRDVVSKWSNFLVMGVNWSRDPNIKPEQLKKQYGFVVGTENAVPVGPKKEKDPIVYAMIFDNAETCRKHLEWFNSCFLTSVEQKQLNEENEKKRKEERKQHRKKFVGFLE